MCSQFIFKVFLINVLLSSCRVYTRKFNWQKYLYLKICNIIKNIFILIKTVKLSRIILVVNLTNLTSYIMQQEIYILDSPYLNFHEFYDTIYCVFLSLFKKPCGVIFLNISLINIIYTKNYQELKCKSCSWVFLSLSVHMHFFVETLCTE